MADVLHVADLKSVVTSPPLYAVIGHPVAHSLSPAMQLAGFHALGIEAGYVRIEIAPAELEQAVEQMRRLPVAGWNITLPHKLAMATLVDEQGPSARLLGGVNTVVNQDGQLTGFNTDGEGWVRAIREEFSLDVADLRILILGTGGVGQALARQAAQEGCERLVLANRTSDRAEALAKELRPQFNSQRLLGAHDRLTVIPFEEEALKRELDVVDLVVNGTSLGLKPTDPPVIPASWIQPHHCVYDTIYRSTRFQQAARSAGARVANGLSMLLHQGALSLELWTGQAAPLEAMRTALREAAHGKS